MDGVGGLTQQPIQPGETFTYEFTLRQHGTFMYHPHFDEMTQMALGMMGMFVIHPRTPERRRASTATSRCMLQRVGDRARARAGRTPTR